MSLSGAAVVTGGRCYRAPGARQRGAQAPRGRVRRDLAGYREGMSLFSKAAKFARSEQGKKAVEKAKEFANKPETKEKIEQVREKVSSKDKQQATGAGDTATAGAAKAGGGTPGAAPSSPGTPGSGSEPTTPPAGGTPPVNEPDPGAVGEQPAQGNPPQAP